MRVSRNRRTATTHEEIEIGTLVGLKHMVAIKLRPSALCSRRSNPILAAPHESSIINFQMDRLVRNVESDCVA